MTLYKHLFVVQVITPECSPDRIITWLEHTPIPVTDHVTRVVATADPATRLATPYMKIDDPPKYRGELSDRKAFAAYQDAFDRWLSETPTIETFRVDGRA